MSAIPEISQNYPHIFHSIQIIMFVQILDIKKKAIFIWANMRHFTITNKGAKRNTSIELDPIDTTDDTAQ